MKLVSLYARVSTTQQAQKEVPIKSQIDEMREWCATNGYTVAEDFIFADQGKTGVNDDRPQFQEMIALASRKPPLFQYILVWDFSRFARNQDDSMLHKAILNKNGVRVLSVKDNIPDSEYGSLIERFIEIKDDVFVHQLSRTIRRGLRALALEGYWLNTTKVPYGYTLTFENENINRAGIAKRHGRLVINEEQAKIVRDIFQYAIRGYSVAQIVDAVSFCGLSKRRIAKMLANRNYTGTRVVYSRVEPKGRTSATPTYSVPDAHPAIVSHSTFDQARLKIKSRAFKNGPGKNGKHIFTGIIRCHCGRNMVHQNGYWICLGKSNAINASCDAKMVMEKQIINVLFDAWDNTLFNETALAEIVDATKQRHQNSDVAHARDHLTVQLAKAKARKQALFDAIENEVMTMDEVKDRMHKLNDQIVGIEIKLASTVDLSQDLSLPKTIKFVQTVRRQLLQENCIERQYAMQSIVEEIVVDRPKLRVKTNFMGMEDEQTLDLISEPKVPEVFYRPDILERRTLRGLAHTRDEVLSIARHIRAYSNDRSITSRCLAKMKTSGMIAYIHRYAILQKDTLAKTEG